MLCLLLSDLGSSGGFLLYLFLGHLGFIWWFYALSVAWSFGVHLVAFCFICCLVIWGSSGGFMLCLLLSDLGSSGGFLLYLLLGHLGFIWWFYVLFVAW